MECMESYRGWTEGYRPYGRFQRVKDLESIEENFMSRGWEERPEE
jgi:hypothetical protein